MDAAGIDAADRRDGIDDARDEAGPGRDAPVADWLDLDELERDPYPSYARLRAMGPVVALPGDGGYVLTRHETIRQAERRPDLFSALVPGDDIEIVTGGRSMLHKDDPEHATERQAINPALRPRAMSEVWSKRFVANAERFIDELEAAGPGQADLVQDFAVPFAAQNIIDLLGLTGSAQARDMARWSREYIDGFQNERRDSEVWERARASRGEVDRVLDSLIPRLREEPDGSLTSHLIEAGLPESIVRSNVHLVISGGVNESKHMVTSLFWALTEHPEQLAAVRQDDELWGRAFDETLRWLSPVGAIVKVTTQGLVWEGIRIPAHAPVMPLLACANRDEEVFEDADRFDIERRHAGHIAFGSGGHQCAGRWVARSSVSDVALPALFRRLPGLRPDPSRRSRIEGWSFRGFTSFPVTW